MLRFIYFSIEEFYLSIEFYFKNDPVRSNILGIYLWLDYGKIYINEDVRFGKNWVIYWSGELSGFIIIRFWIGYASGFLIILPDDRWLYFL